MILLAVAVCAPIVALQLFAVAVSVAALPRVSHAAGAQPLAL